MSQRRVVVTGLGAITPLGKDVSQTWANLVKGQSGIRRINSFDPSFLDSQIAGEVLDYNPNDTLPLKEAKRMERFCQLAGTAALEAWKDSGLDSANISPFDAGVLVGSGIGSLQIIAKHHTLYLQYGTKKFSPFMIPLLIINMAAGWISILLNLKGPSSAVVTACATGTHAIGDAYRIIERGDVTAMVCGGTEGCITPLAVGGFCALKALSRRNAEPEKASRPFEKDRDGFVMGEGAGMVVLEEYEHAKKRSARIYAEVIGYSMTADAFHMTAPHPDGEGATRAMQLVLKDAKANPEDVSYVNAHGTSTELNDKIETLAMKKAFGDHAYKLQINSTKSMTGHLLGAAGGVEAVVCAKSIEEGVVHPTINYMTQDPECDLDYIANEARKHRPKVVMSTSLGFGGHNTCILLRGV